MKNILALDLATTTGWAYYCAQTAKITSGSVLFKHKSQSNGEKFCEFINFLEIFYELKHPDLIIYEEVGFCSSRFAGHSFGGFLGILQMFCCQHKIELKSKSIAEIKRTATNNPKADKQAMIDSAVKYFGIKTRHKCAIKDDNEADALWCLQCEIKLKL